MNFSKEKEKEREEKIANIKVEDVLTGTVESLRTTVHLYVWKTDFPDLYTFPRSARNASNSPKDVLNVGDEVQVKVIGVKDGKIITEHESSWGSHPGGKKKLKVEIPRAKTSEQALAIFSKNIDIIELFHLLVKLKKGPRTFCRM